MFYMMPIISFIVGSQLTAIVLVAPKYLLPEAYTSYNISGLFYWNRSLPRVSLWLLSRISGLSAWASSLPLNTFWFAARHVISWSTPGFLLHILDHHSFHEWVPTTCLSAFWSITCFSLLFCVGTYILYHICNTDVNCAVIPVQTLRKSGYCWSPFKMPLLI